MLNILKQSIDEHSVLWILASGMIGGVIGSFSKFIFETWLAASLKTHRDSLESITRYRHPLLRAGDALDRRLENFIRYGTGKEWFENKEDNYYKLSTLYLLGSYLCWCLITERLALTRHHLSHRSARKFNKGFYRVFKSLTGHGYFGNVLQSSNNRGHIGIPRLQLTSIGEQMAGTPPETWRSSEPDVIGYSDFKRKYRDSSEFREAFSEIEELFTGVTHNRSDGKLNRILIFATALRHFMAELDPHNRDTAPRTIYYLQSMDRDIALAVWQDIWSYSFRSMIGHKGQLPWTFEGKSRRYLKIVWHFWQQQKIWFRKKLRM